MKIVYKSTIFRYEPRRHRAGQTADDAGRRAERRPDNSADGAADRPRGGRASGGAFVDGAIARLLGIGRRRQPREKKGEYQSFGHNSLPNW